jgi:ubiquinone/menaquinone biosynthesis C-methylase UbiE
MDVESLYFADLAAAFVRGQLGIQPEAYLSPDDLVRKGLEVGLRLHKFKRTMGLARVSRVLGILRSLQPATLLDIGSGRGAFLWPLLDAFPTLAVTAIDTTARRVADILAVRDGGVGRLSAQVMDATRLGFDDDTFDVVTMLEVLEHIADTERALAEAVRVARRWVVLSVPSKPDNNPDHIHLFSEGALTRLLHAAGARRVNLDHVLNHRIAVARICEP